MFLSIVATEVQVAPQIASAGAKCWEAASVDRALPIFFPRWREAADGIDTRNATLLVLAHDLLSLIIQVGAGAIMALQFLATAANRATGTRRRLAAVWTRSSEEADSQSSLLTLTASVGRIFGMRRQSSVLSWCGGRRQGSPSFCWSSGIARTDSGLRRCAPGAT